MFFRVHAGAFLADVTVIILADPAGSATLLTGPFVYGVRVGDSPGAPTFRTSYIYMMLPRLTGLIDCFTMTVSLWLKFITAEIRGGFDTKNVALPLSARAPMHDLAAVAVEASTQRDPVVTFGAAIQ